jgi:hypothetical protein
MLIFVRLKTGGLPIMGRDRFCKAYAKLMQMLTQSHGDEMKNWLKFGMVLLVVGLTGIGVSGCVVVSVASAAVSVASTAVNVGVAVGSTAVSATTTVVKGAVNVGGKVVGGGAK